VVELALSEPDIVSESYDSRKIISKRYFDKDLSQEMLLRVIVEEHSSEYVVITVYKTSQFHKYLK